MKTLNDEIIAIMDNAIKEILDRTEGHKSAVRSWAFRLPSAGSCARSPSPSSPVSVFWPFSFPNASRPRHDEKSRPGAA